MTPTWIPVPTALTRHDELLAARAAYIAPIPSDVSATLRAASPRGWWNSALCAQVDPVLFDTDRATPAQLQSARRVCARCPVLTACLATALLRFEYGLWAGTTEAERAAARTDLLHGATLAEVRDRYTPSATDDRRAAVRGPKQPSAEAA
jgi:WhiB family redox-sensing transcriptional regulator